MPDDTNIQLVCPTCGCGEFSENGWRYTSQPVSFTKHDDGTVSEDYDEFEWFDDVRVDAWECTRCGRTWDAENETEPARVHTMESMQAELVEYDAAWIAEHGIDIIDDRSPTERGEGTFEVSEPKPPRFFVARGVHPGRYLALQPGEHAGTWHWVWVPLHNHRHLFDNFASAYNAARMSKGLDDPA